MTINNLRTTGIEVIGKVPWGTHFCQFYQTKQDLLDVLIPFFKAGLENNEMCVWVTSEFLDTREATTAMKQAIPQFTKYLKKGQIEIFPHTEWYLKGGFFEMKRVLKDWVLKHNKALKAGFAGTRVSGNPFWLDNKKDWDDFAAYEAAINKVIDNYKLLVLCTYSLDKCISTEIIDVVSNHEFALIKRQGKWENIESTGHKKLAESLRQSDNRLCSYIELAGQLGWTTNARGEVEEDVPYWRKYTGQSYKQVRGDGWIKALHPDDIKPTMNAWKKAVKNKSAYETEYRVRRYDGVYRNFLVRGIPIMGANNNISDWVGTCIDITERKKTAEKLAEYTKALEELAKSLQKELIKEEALLESIGDGVVAVDINIRVIAVNKKSESIFGWKKQEILGKSLFSNYQLEDAEGRLIPQDLCPIKLALTTAQVVHGVYFLIRGKRKRLPLHITSSPIIVDNSIIGAINVCRDVSQQVEIDRVKDQFISIASHEFRTPLSSISWSLERLTENKDSLSTKQKKNLDSIANQTQRMIQLTNDLLSATRMELDVFSYKYEKINPPDITSKVIATLQNQIKEKKIKFRSIFDKEVNSFKASSNAFYIILHNLLSNAVKFTPKGGKIDLQVIKDNNKLILQVADTGIGIPKSDHHRIFQKMYRADNIKTQVAGTGLGLYITKALVNHMNGKILLTSKLNKGTTFTVSLPFIEETTQRTNEQDFSEYSGAQAAF